MELTTISDVTKVELGCGYQKKPGFFGIDFADLPGVDHVLNVETEPLPFQENQITEIYTSHMMEHLQEPVNYLREMLRACKHDALIEIWTPYGKGADAYGYGHTIFLNEMHFKHICFEYDRFYLGDYHGYFEWEQTHYVLYPGIVDELGSLNIPLEFALEHMFNIALEWGVFLRVKKDRRQAPGAQFPRKIYSEASRTNLIGPGVGRPADLSFISAAIKRIQAWAGVRLSG